MSEQPVERAGGWPGSPAYTFEDLLEVLGGRRLDLDRERAEDLFAGLARPGDVEMTAEGVWSWQVGADRPSMTSPAFMAPKVQLLLEAFCVERIDQPMVGIVPAGFARSAHPFYKGAEHRFPNPRVAVWVVPDADRVAFRVRVPPTDAAIRAMPIPVEGPWRLPPPLPRWKAQEKKFVANDAGRSCPHCEAIPERFRRLTGALGCPLCGRSFAD